MASQQSRLTPAFARDFEAVLQTEGKVTYNELFQNCMKVLWAHGMCYKLTAPCGAFLTHFKNRGRLMLSPHKAHSNGEMIFCIGADMQMLLNAVAIELAPSGELR